MSTGTVYIDARLKDERGNVITMGRVLLGHNAIINPQDVGLSTVKAITFTAWDTLAASIIPGSAGSLAGKDYNRSNPRHITVMAGSIGSQNNLGRNTTAATGSGNYVRVRAFRIRETGTKTLVGTPTSRLYITYSRLGTHPGSVRASYWAVGR